MTPGTGGRTCPRFSVARSSSAEIFTFCLRLNGVVAYKPRLADEHWKRGQNGGAVLGGNAWCRWVERWSGSEESGKNRLTQKRGFGKNRDLAASRKVVLQSLMW